MSDPPMRDGWITVDRGRVAAVTKRAPSNSGQQIDLGEVAVLPGLVNAHTHLELSYLRHEVPPASEFVTWIRAVIAARRRRPDPQSPEILDAVERGLAEAAACGTAIVGDISNTLVSFAPLTRSALGGVVFYELIRFHVADPQTFVEEAWAEVNRLVPTDRVRASLAAHAPYSVAPLVFRAIRQAINRDPFVPSSVHLAESAEELEFIRHGRGPWRELLEDLGVWDPAWVPAGGSPVQFLDDSGFLDARVLAVHGVKTDAQDLARLAKRGTTLVTYPRSNDYTGAGAPPIRNFYTSGVRVAVGTDSLASAPDLNLFSELARMRELAPDVPAATLLDSATRQGARALGFDADYGTIEPGKRARLLAVDIPPLTIDVEEYLVASGVSPGQIRWVSDIAD